MSSVPQLFLNDEFFIDQKVNYFQFENHYKIFDKSGTQIGAVGQKMPGWQKALSLLISKKSMPFLLEIEDTDGSTLVTIKRGWTFIFSKVELLDQNGITIGYFYQKFSLTNSVFKITDPLSNIVGEIRGSWTAWDFKITDANGSIIGTVNKKWAGALREIFSDSDKYYVSIDPAFTEGANKVVLLSAAIAIDMILKENK
jgi:uncharacterized protein YxjI